MLENKKFLDQNHIKKLPERFCALYNSLPISGCAWEEKYERDGKSLEAKSSDATEPSEIEGLSASSVHSKG